MAYNFRKRTCDRCGVDKDKAPKIDTGINHPEYRFSNSFRLGVGGSVLCAACHREEEIAFTIAELDRSDKNKKCHVEGDKV